jgi:hypothetical protein
VANALLANVPLDDVGWSGVFKQRRNTNLPGQFEVNRTTFFVEEHRQVRVRADRPKHVVDDVRTRYIFDLPLDEESFGVDIPIVRSKQTRKSFRECASPPTP